MFSLIKILYKNYRYETLKKEKQIATTKVIETCFS